MKIKTYALAATLLLAAHVATLAQGAQTWQKLAPAGEGFSALLPTRPTEETQTNPDDPRMKMRIYSSEGEGRFFYISSLNMTGLFQANAANFNSFVTGFLKSYCEPSLKRGLTCQTTYERELKLDGFGGKQYKVAVGSGSQTFEGVVRIYMTDRRVYAIQALGGREGDPAIDRFLNSFRIASAGPTAPRKS